MMFGCFHQSRLMRYYAFSIAIVVAFTVRANLQAAEPKPLPGTDPLTLEGDIASQLVDGVDKFLLREIDEAAGKRETFWKRDLSSAEKYDASIEPNRKRL